MTEDKDLVRMKQEYENRRKHASGNDLYSFFNKSHYFLISQRQRSLSQLIRRHNLHPGKVRRVLEIGCGRGGVLQEFLSYGYSTKQLFGIDILFDRLLEASNKLPPVGINCADGQNLPFEGKSFELVLQFTAFSSILNNEIKARMAQEMLRVLCPKGAIIWFDFWLNPTNPQTKGIRKREIRQLFPNCSYEFHKITLAPPIARRIVPVSWILGLILESIKVLNTHYLVIIQKNE